jgi:chromate transport protein ChrA
MKEKPMSTHISTRNPVRSDVPNHADPLPSTTRVRSRGWALAGVGAGLAGIGGIVTSGMVNAVYDRDLLGDADGIAAKLEGQIGAMLAFHGFAMVSAVLLTVFAAGLFRRLRDSLGRDSLAPFLAAAGLVGTGVVLVLGTGLNTEFIFSFMAEEDNVVLDSNAALYNHWIGTIPWCWVLAGLAGTAIYAAYRQGGAPRWLGRTGLGTPTHPDAPSGAQLPSGRQNTSDMRYPVPATAPKGRWVPPVTSRNGGSGASSALTGAHLTAPGRAASRQLARSAPATYSGEAVPTSVSREATTVAWYAHITMDGPDKGTVISPEVMTTTWDENFETIFVDADGEFTRYVPPRAPRATY